MAGANNLMEDTARREGGRGGGRESTCVGRTITHIWQAPLGDFTDALVPPSQFNFLLSRSAHRDSDPATHFLASQGFLWDLGKNLHEPAALAFCRPTKPAQCGWQDVLPLWVAAKSPWTISYSILCVTGWLMQGNTFLGCHVWAGSPGVVFLKWSLSNGFKLLCARACDGAESSQLLKHTQDVFPIVLIQSTHPLLNDSDLFNSQTFLDSNFVHSLLLGKLQVFQTLPLGFFLSSLTNFT